MQAAFGALIWSLDFFLISRSSSPCYFNWVQKNLQYYFTINDKTQLWYLWIPHRTTWIPQRTSMRVLSLIHEVLWGIHVVLWGVYQVPKLSCSCFSEFVRGGQFNCLAELIGQFSYILSKLRSVPDKLVQTDYLNCIQLTYLFTNCFF